MKVLAISTNSDKSISNINKQNLKNIFQQNNSEIKLNSGKDLNLNLLNRNYNQISFSGSLINAKDIEKCRLYQNYKINGESSVYKFIEKSKAMPREIFEFLLGVTKDENLSKNFIEEINQNPRKADKITKVLLDKIGGADNFKAWYYNKDGYQRAYERYFKKEIFENDNISVNDMVKISPNLMVEAMKLKSLKTTGETDFVVGEIPQDIGTLEEFRELTRQVRNSALVKEFIEFRDFMEDTEAFSQKYPEAKKIAINPARFAKDFLKAKISAYRNAKTSEEKIALEKEIPFLKHMNDTTVEVNGKKYTYSPILRPYSTKILFGLQPEGTPNKYFVTMEMFNNEKNTCENIMNKENSVMRSDSPYLNAMVDYYLKSNGCKNVPDMKFYDFKSNAVVYPFIRGVSEKDENLTDKFGVVDESYALEHQLKPLTDLGVFITDCFYENFMFDDTTKETLIVDNGHAKFSNVLKPGVKFIHMGFQDLYGRDFVTLDAGLNRAINVK